MITIFESLKLEEKNPVQMFIVLAILESYNCRASEILEAEWKNFYKDQFLVLIGKKHSSNVIIRDKLILNSIQHLDRLTATQAASVNLSGLEQELFAAHNAQRASAGLAPLQLDGTLTLIARRRANDMAANNYFSHTSPAGETAFSLMAQYGYSFSTAGENLAQNNYANSQTVGVAMNGFMNSSGHRTNILNPAFRRVGVGIAVAPDGSKYFAIVFAG